MLMRRRGFVTGAVVGGAVASHRAAERTQQQMQQQQSQQQLAQAQAEAAAAQQQAAALEREQYQRQQQPQVVAQAPPPPPPAQQAPQPQSQPTIIYVPVPSAQGAPNQAPMALAPPPPAINAARPPPAIAPAKPIIVLFCAHIVDEESPAVKPYGIISVPEGANVRLLQGSIEEGMEPPYEDYILVDYNGKVGKISRLVVHPVQQA